MPDQDEKLAALPPELLILLEAFRREFDAKLGSLKLWGGVALLAGGTIGGIVSAFIGPHTAVVKAGEVASVAVRILT